MLGNRRTVDVAFVRIVAYKRLITAASSFVAACALVWVVNARGATDSKSLWMTAAALLIFCGGGAWSLRDGLRLIHELKAMRGAKSGT